VVSEKSHGMGGACILVYWPKSGMLFLRVAASSNTALILLNLHGDVDDWDIDHPNFRKRILTWAVSESRKIRITLPSASVLSNDKKESLTVLTKLGIEIAELKSLVPQKPPYVIAQVCSKQGVHTLYSSQTTAGAPGERWLHSDSDTIWASSKVTQPLNTTLLDVSNWYQPEFGARILEVTKELDGPVNALSQRLTAFIKKQAPELNELIQHDQAISISYSDRYLKSPWSLILLANFLDLFRNKALTSVTIQTLNPNSQQTPYRVEHDWQSEIDHTAILKLWFGIQFGFAPTLENKNKSRDIQHGRVITVHWASGKTCKVHLDQGMGYWQGRLPYKGALEFDFNGTQTDQINQMTNIFGKGIMQQGGNWPTWISIQIS
jgi:DEAD/DEAH box helicase domain-containing protein